MTKINEPCPYCGVVVGCLEDAKYGKLIHPYCRCLEQPYEDAGYLAKNWNNRPLEAALEARLQKALEALKKLADPDNYDTGYDEIFWTVEDDSEPDPWSYAARIVKELEQK